MARIVNPQNIDVDDDAVFMGALSQGLIWVDDDDDNRYQHKPQIDPLESSNQTIVHIFKEHSRSVNYIAVSGDFIISASDDRTLGVSNWKTGEHLHKLRGHKASVNAVVIQDDIAISASADKTIRFWNWKTGERIHKTDKLSHSVTELDIHGDFVVASLSNEVWILNWQTIEFVQKLTGVHSTDIISVSIQGDLVFSMSWKLLLVRNWKTGEIIHQTDVDYSKQQTGVFLDKDFAVFGGYNSVEIWDWKSGEYLGKSILSNKNNSQINQKAFPTSFGIFIYSLKSAIWCHYRVDAAYDQATVLVDNYSQMVTADHGGWIYVIDMNPSLKRLLKKNTNYSPKKAKKTEIAHNYEVGDVLAEISNFILERDEQWVNFTRVDQHIRNTFPQVDLRQLEGTSKKYKHLRKLIEDYPQQFILRPDEHKSGLFYIRLADSYSINHILVEISDFIHRRDEQWVNFTRLDQHMRNTFPELDLHHLKGTSKKYKHLRKLTEDYPQRFTLRDDQDKPGLFYIRLTN